MRPPTSRSICGEVSGKRLSDRRAESRNDGGFSGPWLPTVGSPTRVEFEGPRAEELASELWLNTDTDTAVVPRRLLGGERYRMSALLPPAPATELPEDLDVASGGSSSQDLDLLDARLDSWTSRAEGS